MTVCTTLREANITRQREWDTGGKIDLSYAGNELAGEVSEAIEQAVLQINYPEQPVDLANELADVMICCDLIAIQAGLPILCARDPVVMPRDQTQSWVNELGSDLQGVCNTIKKLERERHGMAGSRASLSDLAEGLRLVMFDSYAIAACQGINLDVAVAEKFNATSAKVGLHTRLDPFPNSTTIEGLYGSN